MNETSQSDERIFELLLTEAMWESTEEEFAAIPPESELRKMYTFSKRHEQNMQKILRSSKKRGFPNARIGFAAAIMFAILTSFAFTPAARASLMDWVKRIFGQYTQFAPPDTPNNETKTYPLQFPVGFHEINASVAGSFSRWVYADEEGTILTLIHGSDRQVFDLNNENITTTTVYNDGITYECYESTDASIENAVVWNIGRDFYSLSSQIPVGEIQAIAKSLNAKP